MQNWTYCVVGNIKKTHYDENGTLRYGTAAFTGGTKVYLCGRIWDRTRDHIDVLGKTRAKKWQAVWTDISQIENLRCQKVFHSSILDFMNNHEFCSCWWGKSKKEKADAEAFVQWWNQTIAPKTEGDGKCHRPEAQETGEAETRDRQRSIVYGSLPKEHQSEWFQLPCHSNQVSSLWMSAAMWSNPILIDANYQKQNLPSALKSMVDFWRREAQEEQKTFEKTWYEKYAALRFVWFGEFYKMIPSALGISPEFFCWYSCRIEQQLHAAGCPYALYTGCID